MSLVLGFLDLAGSKKRGASESKSELSKGSGQVDSHYGTYSSPTASGSFFLL